MMAELAAMTTERNESHRRSINIANNLRDSYEELATRPLDAEFFLD